MVPEKIRNVALIGHGGSGKTSLAEAVLFVAGVTNRQGSVDQGTSLLDNEPEEVERKQSLSLGVATFEWRDHQINILDTPGFADFSGDARAALRAADLALFVVSAVDGVEVQTELMWKAAAEENIPRAIVISKLDRDRASFERTLSQLKEAFGKRVAPVQVPLDSGGKLNGLVRIVSERAYEYSPGDPVARQVDLPEGVSDRVHTAHTALIESVVETDDALMEAYFEGREPSREVIVETVHRGMLAGDIFPVLVTSAHALVGIDLLAEFLIDYAPNPLEHAVLPVSEGDVTISESGPVVAYVFKTVSDPFVGRISMFRVFSGSFEVDTELELATGGRVRMHNLFRMQGADHHDIRDVTLGEIAAVAKAEQARGGDTLRSPGSGVVIVPIAQSRPVMEFALTPRSAQDDEKLSTALARITEEDPTIAVERRAETGETILAGLGDTHLEVTIARIARKYGVEVDTALPTIPYRSTITSSVEAEGKHKKQSGGRGQFGVVTVKFAPRPRGTGFEFIDSVKGGSVPRQFIPAVAKGIEEALSQGIVGGFPVIDMSAELLDGKYHPVDSDEMSFRMAGVQAVRAAGPSLGAVLLEPIMAIVVRVPEDYTGDIMGDINAKRGRVLGMDTDGGVRVIEAQVPMSEVQRYAVDLRSMTSGRGSFEVTFDHYEEVPHQEAQRIIDAAERDD